MTNVLLINAPVDDPFENRHARLTPPLGLSYIGAVLQDEGYSVSAIDFNIRGLNERRLENAIDRESPEIIGISAHTETYPNGLEIASLVKDLDPSVTTVIGGPHVSVTYEETALNDEIDIVVRGEGELTMLELTDAIVGGDGHDFRSIDGIAFQEGDSVVATPPRDFIDDPDELPLPARDLFPLYLYEHPANVLASRGGCPFQCRFCAVNNIWKGGRRFRDPDAIVDEIKHIFQHYKIQQINFADDTFTLNREQTMAVVQRLNDLNAPFPWVWTCSTRADLVDRELLEAMAAAGCTNIQYGVEAGNEGTLDVIGKGISLEEVRNAVRMALDVGMEVQCSFMYPHPDDTEETIRDQIAFMKELDEMGANLVLSFTAPFPGTYYAQRMDDLGLELHAESWTDYDCEQLIISTEQLSLDDLRSMFKELYHEVGLRSVKREAISEV